MTNPGQHSEIQQSANRRHNQHWNSDGILMPSLCGCIDAAGGCQCRKPDRHADPADRQYRCTKTLQKGKHRTCPANCPHLPQADQGRRRADVLRILLLFLNLQATDSVLTGGTGEHLFDVRQPKSKATRCRPIQKPAWPVHKAKGPVQRFSFSACPLSL